MRRVRLVPLLAVAILALALVLPASAFAVRRVAISSGSFKFDTAAGKTVDGEITVINDGDEPIKVMVYTADQSVDGKGVVSYNVPTRVDLASSTQPSAWTRIFMPADSKAVGNIPYLEMAPKQRVPIKFSVTIPAGATPGDHNVMIFFEMFSGQAPAGSGAQVSGRIGSRIQLRLAGEMVEKLDLSRFAVPTFVTGNAISTEFTLRNVGNVDQRVVANVRLLDRNGDPVVEQKPINNRLVFAEKNLEASATLSSSKQLFGQYSVAVEVVPVNEEGQPVGGGKNTIIERRDVWFVPLWAIIAVIVVLAGIVLRIVWGAGRKSAAKRHAKEAAAAAAAAQPAATAAGGPSAAEERPAQDSESA